MNPRPFREPIALTGAGAVCNLGTTLPEIGAWLRAGRPGRFATIEQAVTQQARCQLGGLVTDLDVSDEALGLERAHGRFMGRSARLALHAARGAIAESGVDADRLGVVLGSGAADVASHVSIQETLTRTGSMRRVGPTVIPRIMSSTVSATLGVALGLRGPSVTAVAACAGGAWNIGIAALLIDAGLADAVLAGGAECWDPHFHAGFDSMRAYNGSDNDRPEHASRPYAADRAGFVMGEGAAAVVLEPLSAARARGATIRGLLLGFGASSDGSGEMVAPVPDGAIRAMRTALAHANVEPAAIGYVNTHATSTPAGDVSEVEALRAVFGRHLPYSSTKGATGHTITAAGALEAVFTWEMLAGGWLAPSVNADPLDPALLDYPPLRAPTDARVCVAMSNAFGFGGTNATLILGAPPA